MATLDELLVELGVDADALLSGATAAADGVEDALAGIGEAAQDAARVVDSASDRAADSLDAVGDAADAAGDDAAAAAREVADSVEKVGRSAQEAADGAQQAAADTEQSLRGVAAAAAGAMVGAAFTQALTDAMDASAARTRLANQLGLTQAEAQRAGDVAGQVFTAGFGESIGDVSDAVGGVVGAVGGLGEATDAEFTQMTKSALGLVSVFDFDLNEATQAAGTLLKAGLAKDGQDAFDLLTAAAQKLPPMMRDELPSIAMEYSQFFDQLGFTGPQMFGLLAQAAQDPTFQLDKLGDAVKEFTLLLADTDAVSEPLKELGLDVTEIQDLVNTGRGTEAFDQVTGALREVEDQTERTRLQAALFGGPGEDMAGALLNLDATGAAAATGLDDAAGAAAEMTDSMQASPAQQLDAITRTLSATLGELLAPALATVNQFAAQHPAAFKAIAAVLVILAGALAVAAVAQWAMNSAMLASPVTWIILGIAALVAGIIWVATQTTWFQTIWQTMTSALGTAWDWIWGKLQAGFELLKNLFLNFTGPGLMIKHFGTIRDTVASAIDSVQTKVQSGVDKVMGALRSIQGIIGTVIGYFGRIRDGVSDKISSAVDLAKGMPGRIRRGVGDLGNLLVGAGKDIIRGLISGINDMLGSLRSKLSSVTGMIPDWKGPMSVDLQLLTPSGEAIMSGLMDGIDNRLPALHRQLGDITTQVPGNVNAGVARAATAPQAPPTVVFDVTGGEDDLVRLVRKWVRTRGRGNVQTAFGT